MRLRLRAETQDTDTAGTPLVYHNTHLTLIWCTAPRTLIVTSSPETSGSFPYDPGPGLERPNTPPRHRLSAELRSHPKSPLSPSGARFGAAVVVSPSSDHPYPTKLPPNYGYEVPVLGTHPTTHFSRPPGANQLPQQSTLRDLSYHIWK